VGENLTLQVSFCEVELNLKVHFLTWNQSRGSEPILVKIVVCWAYCSIRYCTAIRLLINV